MYRMTADLLQQGIDAARILGADPVELEAVGHGQRQARIVGLDLGGERLDPGVELLLWQLGCQPLAAACPQVRQHVVWVDNPGKGARL